MASLSIRIDLDPEGRIGPGKIELLEAIRREGSISAAGRAMDMSYRRAWDLVDETARICGQSVVASQAGGKHGGGARLTEYGEELIARYRAIEKAAQKAARTELQALESGRRRPASATDVKVRAKGAA
ncbi:winged helix-turn-helix domain-containing protein [Hansschlegelia quercus]|uniref:LysR family transcriptional regulator n=1 Tax=Hansschlegelia quercus TaxID=2528245 RepID=A0A4Q9GFK4_9HYPH|nr:winged helix-turn-helix domain-containing protein [Hansschlegelia quercus]TBN51731.1 LysR family transcriptional regulator [Hansschlegelia quercus]